MKTKTAILEEVPDLLALVGFMWRGAALTDRNADFFEAFMYQIAHDLGDDDLIEELMFLVSINYERI